MNSESSKPAKRLRFFLREEHGAVSLDWAALTGILLVFSVWAANNMFEPAADVATRTDETMGNGSIISRNFKQDGGFISRSLPGESYTLSTSQTCAMSWAAIVSDCESKAVEADCKSFEMRDGARLQKCSLRAPERAGYIAHVFMDENGNPVPVPKNADRYTR